MFVKYIGAKYPSQCFIDEKYKYEMFTKNEVKEVNEVRGTYLLENFPKQFIEVPAPVVEEKALPPAQDKMLRKSKRKELDNGSKSECLDDADIL